MIPKRCIIKLKTKAQDIKTLEENRIIPLQCLYSYRYIGQNKKKKITIKENHKFVFSKPKSSIDQKQQLSSIPEK